ncbi:MAG: hypothetical protein J0H86_23985 [Xanthomonadaceae bacterium]|nr:hypothetical protein [Xanthomonadaceae bacterium]
MPKKKRVAPAAVPAPAVSSQSKVGAWLKDHAGWVVALVLAIVAGREALMAQRVRLHGAIAVDVVVRKTGQPAASTLRATVVNTGRQPVVLRNLVQFIVVDPSDSTPTPTTYVGAFGAATRDGPPVVLQPGIPLEASAPAGSPAAIVGPTHRYGLILEDQDGEWFNLPTMPGGIGSADADRMLNSKEWEYRRLSLASGELVKAPSKGTASMSTLPAGASP